MTAPIAISQSYIEDRSIPEPNSGCWLWLRAKNSNGYGSVGNREIGYQGAHRVSFAVFRNDPGKLHVLHICDTPLCVNPDHLFLGTQKDNIRDSIRKGRFRLKPLKTTPPEIVDAIRKAHGTQLSIAKRFGVGEATVNRIKNKLTYWETKGDFRSTSGGSPQATERNQADTTGRRA